MTQQLSMVRGSERLYRVLLLAYPVSFRRRFGDEMRLVFRECCRDAIQASGGSGLVGHWLLTLSDLARTAAKERVNSFLQVLMRYFMKGQPAMIDITLFDRQLSDTAMAISVLLRSGYSVMQIIEQLADKAPEPTASVFKGFLEDARHSKDWHAAMERAKANVPSVHLRTLFDTFAQQMREGGNLADGIEPVAAAIREQAGEEKAAAAFLAEVKESVAAPQ